MSRDIMSEARWLKLTRHAALIGMFLFVAAGVAYSARLLTARSYFWLVGITLTAYLVGLLAAERRD
ncbi:MAG: hypothetical protein ABW061_06520 [Polyangiaceae bacterium]